MKIKDLPGPVTASKADWLAGTTWLGFSPANGSQLARNKCQSTIQRQFDGGYVIEYATEQFNDPNSGFENDPEYMAERDSHRELAGRFIAVHKLLTTARSLETILGPDAFKRLQDMWAQDGKRYRWSVAFPIVESYEIIGRPKAKSILGEESYRRLYQRPSATLRILNDEDRKLISNLDLRPITTTNAWIGIEDEFRIAEAGKIDAKLQRLIDHDLGALEGITEERLAKVKRRAAWLAGKFISARSKAGKLVCDACEFDPARVIDAARIRPRSLLDVHHIKPLDEGTRYTTIGDFALLCPTCHRVEHACLRVGGSYLAGLKADQ